MNGSLWAIRLTDGGAQTAVLLRVDPKLWAEVEKWAADELRSVNAQVEYLLREAVEGAGGREADPGPGGDAPHG